MLRKDRHPNFDFFVADLWLWTPKDDQASMEHPFFSLSKKADTAERRYEHNGVTIEIIPGVRGLPTIWDKDVLIYCTSQLVEGMKQDRLPYSIVRFQVFDFLVSANRSTGQKGYKLLEKALDRLRSVSIKTNIRTGNQIEIANFGLLDWWHMVVEEPNVTVQVKLSDWLYRAVTSLEVLTIHRDYFRLDGGLERRVYELCRKHCGQQDKWHIALGTLHKKSGSASPVKMFRHYVKRLVQSDHLPEYHLVFKNDKLTVYPRTHKGGLRELKDVLGIAPQ